MLSRQDALEGGSRLRDSLTHLSVSMAIRLQRAPEKVGMFKGFAMLQCAWDARPLYGSFF